MLHTSILEFFTLYKYELKLFSNINQKKNEFDNAIETRDICTILNVLVDIFDTELTSLYSVINEPTEKIIEKVSEINYIITTHDIKVLPDLYVKYIEPTIEEYLDKL